MAKTTILIFGPSPISSKGGISTALDNLLNELRKRDVPFLFYCTHDNRRFLRQLVPFAPTLGRLIFDVLIGKIKSTEAVGFLHAGPSISLVRKLILAVALRALRIKIITQYHSPRFEDYLHRWPARVALKTISGLSSSNLAISVYWKKIFQKNGFQRLCVVPNMAPAPDGIATDQEAIGHTSINILTMCRLEEGKSVDSVLFALTHLPEKYKLTVCGTGRQYLPLKKLCYQLGLQDRVFFLGWVSEAQKNYVLANAHLFCLPSEYESFGMGYIEAMSFGCPLIGRDIGPTRAVISESALGALWDGKDPFELAKLIETEARRDDNLARFYRRSHFERYYSAPSVFNKLDHVIKMVANNEICD